MQIHLHPQYSILHSMQKPPLNMELTLHPFLRSTALIHFALQSAPVLGGYNCCDEPTGPHPSPEGHFSSRFVFLNTGEAISCFRFVFSCCTLLRLFAYNIQWSELRVMKLKLNIWTPVTGMLETTCHYMWFAPRSRRNNIRVIMSIDGRTVIMKAGSPREPKLQLKTVRLQG